MLRSDIQSVFCRSEVAEPFNAIDGFHQFAPDLCRNPFVAKDTTRTKELALK